MMLWQQYMNYLSRNVDERKLQLNISEMSVQSINCNLTRKRHAVNLVFQA